MVDSDDSQQPSLDTRVFWTSAAAVFGASFLLIAFPEPAANMAQAMMRFITHQFGWVYLLTGVGPLLFAAWLAFGRFGNVKLGAPDDKPEYSTYSWLGMMFTASMGASLIAWGFAEPIYYIQTPPLGAEPMSTRAIELAHVYPIFHWSFAPWAIYCLPCVPIAYMLYVRRARTLRISDSCDEAISQKIRSPAKKFIDVLVVISIAGGVSTSIGFGVPLVSALIGRLFGIPDTLWVQLIVVAMWTAIFGTSAYRGLKKGIKILADINITMMVMLLLFVLVLGPTLYILSFQVNSLGLLISEYARMSFWTDPVEQGGFPEAWTIFYLAWWFAYSPMMGLFFARISRGRTIKQVIVGIIGLGSLGTFMFMGVAGAFILYLHSQGTIDAISILNDQGMATLVAVAIGELPFSTFILGFTLVLTIIFYATTFDSAAYVLAGISTKNLPGDQEPGRMTRVAWAIGLGLMAVGLMVAGGFQTVQSITVITSLSAVPVLFMMCYTLYKWLGADFPGLARRPVHSRQK